MKNALRLGWLLGIVLMQVAPATAQSPPTPQTLDSPPNLLVIYREEVRPGKGAAHTANEQAWAAAFTKGQACGRTFDSPSGR